MNNRIIVLGGGMIGSAIARDLAEESHIVTVADRDKNIHKHLMQFNILFKELDFLDLLSSLAPCILGYGEIGLNLKDFKPDNVMYQKWIETYASNEYQDVSRTEGRAD